MQHYRFFEGDISGLCARARSVKVRDMMHPVEEFIDEDASLSEAIYKLVLYDTLSVLVTRKGKVVGLVRLDDVCQEVAQLIKEASPE
jgi:predicted transcriptional regulator